GGELLAQRGVAERVDAAADRRGVAVDGVAEHLDEADLAAALRAVLHADHPGREHRPRPERRPALDLDPAVQRHEPARLRLLLAHHETVAERLLSLGAPDGPGPV